MSDNRPLNCRFRLQEERKPYPKSSCEGCGKTIATGLGVKCSHHPDAAHKTFGGFWADELTGQECGKMVQLIHDGSVVGVISSEVWNRIKPEPEKGTVVLHGAVAEDGEAIFVTAPHKCRHTLTIPTKDGKPIPNTYRSEAGDELIVGETNADDEQQS